LERVRVALFINFIIETLRDTKRTIKHHKKFADGSFHQQLSHESLHANANTGVIPRRYPPNIPKSFLENVLENEVSEHIRAHQWKRLLDEFFDTLIQDDYFHEELEDEIFPGLKSKYHHLHNFHHHRRQRKQHKRQSEFHSLDERAIRLGGKLFHALKPEQNEALTKADFISIFRSALPERSRSKTRLDHDAVINAVLVYFNLGENTVISEREMKVSLGRTVRGVFDTNTDSPSSNVFKEHFESGGDWQRVY
jgi:hypothetical protein